MFNKNSFEYYIYVPEEVEDKSAEFKRLIEAYGLNKKNCLLTSKKNESYNPSLLYVLALRIQLEDRPNQDYKEHLDKIIEDLNKQSIDIRKETKTTQQELMNHPLLDLNVLRKFRFYLYQGPVRSIYDGDSHYISYQQLMNCYGLPANLCVNGERFDSSSRKGRSYQYKPTDISLYWQEKGNYREVLVNRIKAAYKEMGWHEET